MRIERFVKLATSSIGAQSLWPVRRTSMPRSNHRGRDRAGRATPPAG